MNIGKALHMAANGEELLPSLRDFCSLVQPYPTLAALRADGLRLPSTSPEAQDQIAALSLFAEEVITPAGSRIGDAVG